MTLRAGGKPVVRARDRGLTVRPECDSTSQVRRWVRALAAAACPLAADEVELATAELITNAIRHTRRDGASCVDFLRMTETWRAAQT